MVIGGLNRFKSAVGCCEGPSIVDREALELCSYLMCASARVYTLLPSSESENCVQGREERVGRLARQLLYLFRMQDTVSVTPVRPTASSVLHNDQQIQNRDHARTHHLLAATGGNAACGIPVGRWLPDGGYPRLSPSFSLPLQRSDLPSRLTFFSFPRHDSPMGRAI